MSLAWTVVTLRIIVYIVVSTSYLLLGMGEDIIINIVCVGVHTWVCVRVRAVCVYSLVIYCQCGRVTHA